MTADKSRIFDASSLIELIQRGDGATAAAMGQYTLDLAFYEAGNSFWRDSAGLQLLSREEATDAVDFLDSVRGEMYVLSLSDIGATTVFDTAWGEGVTYYDAAYITAARDTNAILVTEDGGMADSAPQSVTVRTTEELLED